MAAANSLRPSVKRPCCGRSIAVSGAAHGTRSNFITGADRTRRCSIAWCYAGTVIARRISGGTNLLSQIGTGIGTGRNGTGW